MSEVRSVVVMGVSGTGKTEVGTRLAQRLGARFVEGDDLHPQANRDLMHAGIPLTDEDRWPWLHRIADVLARAVTDGESTVTACSALKRAYRDVLCEHGPVFFVLLTGDRDLLERRLSARKGHFMPASMLDSQLDTLEPLAVDEAGAEIDVAPALDDVVAAAERAVARQPRR